MEEVRAYLESLSNEELFKEYCDQYVEWEKTGVLNDGIIRTIEEKLNNIDDAFNVHGAERLFKNECMNRFAAMMIMTDIKISKYNGVIETLKENQSQDVPNDTYDYETDLKHTSEFVRDLKAIKK